MTGKKRVILDMLPRREIRVAVVVENHHNRFNQIHSVKQGLDLMLAIDIAQCQGKRIKGHITQDSFQGIRWEAKIWRGMLNR